jgi:organic hydroperoxide reductase OsmC/OhrA
MADFPHHYQVSASAAADGPVTVASDGLPELASTAPPQFGGPPGHWAPETLFVASVADCFVLSFRAIARASHLDYERVECDAEGLLDRAEGKMRFTELHLRARLVLPAGGDPERGRRLLEKAERSCLVTNSLALEPTLACDVAVRA